LCPVCENVGSLLYEGLGDRILDAKGIWSIRCCNRHGVVLWLSPLPRAADLDAAYDSYYTHGTPGAQRSLVGMVNDRLTTVAAAFHYGYRRKPPSGAVRWLSRALIAISPGGMNEVGARIGFLPFPGKGARLLDVGCGSGAFISRMQTLGWSVSGIDTDPAAVEAAATRGLDVKCADLRASCWAEESFDAVTLIHVVEHVADPGALIEKATRLLKPGGRLIILTPNANSLGHAIFRDAWYSLDPPRHLTILSGRALAVMLDRCELKIERSGTTSRNARGVWYSSLRIFRRKPAHSAMPAVLQHLVGLPFQLIERVALSVTPRIGEEIVVIARRPMEKSPQSSPVRNRGTSTS